MDQDIPDGLEIPNGLGNVEAPGIPDAIPMSPEKARPVVPQGRRHGADGRLDAETRRRIGRGLRVLYASLLAQPIPERFEVLVAAFAARSGEESAR